MRLAHLLSVVLCTLLITTVNSQISASIGNYNSSYCCSSKPGPQVAPAPLSLADIVNDSPYYGQVTNTIYYTQNLDNFCYTYFIIDDISYIQFTSYRYSDGSYLIEKFIISALTGYPGASRLQGLARTGTSSFVFDEVYLGSACPGVKVYYRNYIAGPCELVANLSLVEGDLVHGDSSSRDISEYCKGQVAAVANNQQFRGTELVGLPNQLDRRCVTQFNGANCVNANRVLPQDSVSVPDTS